jgi:hypothetical protein
MCTSQRQRAYLLLRFQFARSQLNLPHSATSRTLQNTVSAHKHTTADLQRTRMSLQALRATHASELRKRDKESERVLERWAKLSDGQLRLSTSASSGLTFAGARCANAIVGGGSSILGRGKGYLEVALQEAEKGRVELAEENSRLRRMLLRAVNEAQGIVHELKMVAHEQSDETEVCSIYVVIVSWMLNVISLNHSPCKRCSPSRVIT